MNTENQQPDSNVKATIDAVTGLAKEIPIYPDAIQPAAKEIGKGLETVAKAVNIGLAPVAALVWGYEKIKQYLEVTLSKKLANVPKDKIVSPPIEVAGPAIESLRFTENQPALRELFANLLASAMNSDTQQNVHPGFVEIIKNLSADECLLLSHISEDDRHNISLGMPFLTILKKIYGENRRHLETLISYDTLTPIQLKNIGIKDSELVPSYMYNLERLGLIKINTFISLHISQYDDLFISPIVRGLVERTAKHNESLKSRNSEFSSELEYVKGSIGLTPYGREFLFTVVNN